MKNLFFLGLITVAIFLPDSLMAQLKVDAELRPRFEVNHGYMSLPIESSEATFFVSQRTRININYKNKNFTSHFSFQDIRLWGQEDIATKTGIQASSIGLDVSQAWFNWEFAKNWGIKTGRQVWNYDDGRFLSDRNWNTNGLSYDALLLHFDKSDFHFHLGSSINNTHPSFNQNSYDIEDNPYEEPLGYRIRYLNFIWLKFHVSEALTISLADYLTSYLAKNTKSTFYMLSTSGLHFNYKTKRIKVLANAFYQYGKNAKGNDHNAYMFTISTHFHVSKFDFGVGFDYLSGDKDEKGYQAFDMLYGACHKYQGWMNYYLLPKDTDDAGLMDLYPNITWTINKKHSLYAAYHFFWLAQDHHDYLDCGDELPYPIPECGDSNINRNLGGELNMSYTYKYDKNFNATFFFGYYNATVTTEHIKDIEKGKSTTPIWASLMLTYKPILFEK